MKWHRIQIKETRTHILTHPLPATHTAFIKVAKSDRLHRREECKWQEPLIQSSSTQYEEDFFINQWFLFSVAMVTLFIVFYIKIIKEDQQLSSSDAEITSYAFEV